MYRSAATDTDTNRYRKPNRRYFRVWNSQSRDHVTVAIPDAAFRRFCSYTQYAVRSTIGLLSDSYASYILLATTFYRAMLAQSAVMRLHVVCLSVRLSVTFRYRVQIGLNSLKIISQPNSLRLLWLTPNMGDLVQREHPQN